MKIRWGRHSRVYVNDVRILNINDLEVSDEATDHKLEPRDLSHALHLTGGKDCLPSFGMLETDHASFDLLEDAYDAHTADLEVVLVVDGREESSPALTFTGCVLRFHRRRPENGPATVEVLLAVAGHEAADMPTRTTWNNPD